MGKGAIRESGTAVIVEGYMDVIQAHQAGYLNVVAQMGTAMTEKQIRLVAPRFASKIVLALDADEAGQNAARRSLDVARQACPAIMRAGCRWICASFKCRRAKIRMTFLRHSPGGLGSNSRRRAAGRRLCDRYRGRRAAE